MSVKVLKERERKYANMQISKLSRESLHICGLVCVFARGYLHILVSVAGHSVNVLKEEKKECPDPGPALESSP